MSPKSFVKDVVKLLELVTLKSDRADAVGPSCSNTINDQKSGHVAYTSMDTLLTHILVANGKTIDHKIFFNVQRA